VFFVFFVCFFIVWRRGVFLHVILIFFVFFVCFCVFFCMFFYCLAKGRFSARDFDFFCVFCVFLCVFLLFGEGAFFCT